jgi:DNA-binding IclR family transcriptional regulator
MHIIHSPGEAHAHLEHLVEEGLVNQDGEKYDLTERTKTELETLNEEDWPLR